MKKLTIGIIAHVDSGKTTLSEALLYLSGARRSFGRVDKGESFLDTDVLERKRGITIYSKQAGFQYGETLFTLLDTPGHSDFSAEMERTLQVLDYALLIISAADGVKGQTETLWKLLRDYQVPTIVFFNKVDQLAQETAGKKKLLAEVNSVLSDAIVDFTDVIDCFENETVKTDNLQAETSESLKKALEELYDRAAMCSEEAMDEYLETGKVSAGLIRDMIGERKLFPCFFGSALKCEGVDRLLTGMDNLTLETDYPEEFGARVFKITRDSSGKRLTMMKITGGSLKNRSVLPDGEEESKINQLRVYSGEKFTAINEAFPGDVVAVDGLLNSFAGQGFGYEAETVLPLLSPVLNYRVILPSGADPVVCIRYFKTIEEESPELSVKWDEENSDIFIQVMGEVQLEVLKSVMDSRFKLKVEFDIGQIIYKETIGAPVIGVGHFEPLRHYAEVHLLLEPLPEGSGLIFDTNVSTDVLAKNWQRLILTHLGEKEHRGVLTGSAITDMRITVINGRAHNKHTEGGDFRKATYRAVRQGLMMAESKLLEPYYRFTLAVPSDCVGRAMTDLDRMKAEFGSPELEGERSVISGKVPVAALGDYAKEIAAYTKGKGNIGLIPCGYGPCHNPEEVVAQRGYDPLGDTRNTPDSVFCQGGSGIVVPYDQVYDHMHVPFASSLGKDSESISRAAALYVSGLISGNGEEITGGLYGDGSTIVAERVKPGYLNMGYQEVDSIISGISRSGEENSRRLGWRRRKKKSSFGIDDSAYSGISGMHGIGGSNTVSKKKVDISGIFPVEQAEYLLVDGYNVIFAWKELAELATENMDAARITLQEKLCNWQAVTGSEVIVVYDAYKVKGHNTEIEEYLNIHLVFTKEAETADQYIEKFAHEHGRKYRVAVVTSDGLEQVIIRGQGCSLVSSREFEKKIESKTLDWNKRIRTY